MVPEPTDTAVVITADDARRLTDQIKLAVEATWQLVIDAYETRAWAALGYSSWDDYCTREFGACRLRLPREERSEVVGSLRDAGLSIRAIAAATGDSPRTVQRALAPVANATPEPVEEIIEGHAIHPALAGVPDDELAEIMQLAQIPDDSFEETIEECKKTGDLSRAAVVRAAVVRRGEMVDGGPTGASAEVAGARSRVESTPASTVIGTDGKRYPATQSTPPKRASKPQAWRRPFPEVIRSAVSEMRETAELLQQLNEDDRFGTCAEQLAMGVPGDLVFTIEVCQQLLDLLEAGA